jgi:DNA-binding CsgD family transcriptional regulator
MTTAGEHDLSEREIEILRLVATGASNKEIANKLVISPNTVKVHLRNIFTKIGAASRTEAAMFAVRIGLVESPQSASDQVTEQDNGATLAMPITVFTRDEKNSRTTWLRQNRFILLLTLALLLIISAGAFLMWSGFLNPGRTGEELITALPTSTTESRWRQLANLPTAREGLAGVYSLNRIYAIGGETTLGISGSVDIYDLGTDSWAVGAGKPVPVKDIQAASIDGKIYIPGGEAADGVWSKTLEIYDPATNEWEEGTPLPTPVSEYALTAFDGKVIILGGWDGQKVSNQVYAYDPTSKIWTTLPPLQTNRAAMGAALIGDRVFLIGGWDGDAILDDVEIYSLSQNSVMEVSQVIQLPQARRKLSAVTLVDNIFVIGGETLDGDEIDPFGFQYAQLNNQWGEIAAASNSSWTDFGFTGTGTHIFLFGGKVDGIITDRVMSYQAINILFFPLVK